MAGYPSDKSLIDRSRHFWDRYIAWGSAHPLRQKAMSQLAVSDRITEECKELVGDAFGQVNDMLHECAAGGAMRNQPPSFVSAILSAIADTTMDLSLVSLHRPSATQRLGLMRSGTQSPADFFV
jgi:hypothetical protein